MVVMGLESELGLLGVRPLLILRERVGRSILDAVAATQPAAAGWGSKHRSTLFLANGSAIGLDPPRAVPELSTPECVDPFDLAACHRAGLALISQAAATVGESLGHRLTPLVASTFHQPGDVSLGTHENYGVPTAIEPAALLRGLLTWIVVRQVLTEPGVVSGAPGSNGFALAPRAELMTRISGPYTTHDRAIFTTCRLNYAGRGWRRLHVIPAGATASSWAIAIRHGVTALIIEMLLRGEPWPDELTLRYPLRALRTVSQMPESPISTAAGGESTPIALNERLHAHVAAAQAREPLAEWAPRLLAEWQRGIHAMVAGSEEEKSLLLEPVLRRRVLSAFLAEAGVSWRVARLWADFFDRVRALLAVGGETTPLPVTATAAQRSLGHESAQVLELELKAAGFSWQDYPRFRRVVDGLYTLDIELSRAGDGLGIRLDDAPPEEERLVPTGRWRAFMQSPPPGTRAEARGRLITRHQRAPDLRASWAGVVAEGRVYDLPSPLSALEPVPRD
jgi:hypothetical protein